MTNCLFCNFPQHKKIYEDSTVYVIKDEFPVTKGHLLIIPKEHIATWFDASFELQTHLIKILSLMKKEMEPVLAPDGYNIGLNCGKASGQTIMHLHLIPRYFGDSKKTRGGIRGVIPEKQSY